MDPLKNITVLVGLGNPGTKYRYTYHNVGRLIADYLASDVSFSSYRNFSYCRLDRLTIVKTETFMNESGAAVSAALSFLNASPTNLLLIHDDSDQTLGRSKIVSGGSAGGHHGVESVLAALGLDAFPRFKVGIRPPLSPGRPRPRAEEFVLKKIPLADRAVIYRSGDSLIKKLKLNDTRSPM